MCQASIEVLLLFPRKQTDEGLTHFSSKFYTRYAMRVPLTFPIWITPKEGLLASLSMSLLFNTCWDCLRQPQEPSWKSSLCSLSLSLSLCATELLGLIKSHKQSSLSCSASFFQPWKLASPELQGTLRVSGSNSLIQLSQKRNWPMLYWHSHTLAFKDSKIRKINVNRLGHPSPNSNNITRKKFP